MDALQLNQHLPVMLNEVLSVFKEHSGSPQIFLDGTFGRGGHCREILKNFPNLKTVAMDRDVAAIEFGQQVFAEEISSQKMKMVHGEFSHAKEILGKEANFDFILLDLGVSSPQLDRAERGFSFYHDGPLDMRMDQNGGWETAADVVNTYPEAELNKIFQTYGEINRPYRVVKAIVNDRKAERYTSTKQLASLIERVDGWQRKGHHPATRYFLALRLHVNRELEVLENGLPQLLQCLNDKGRIVVLTFHSLEDRIVKNCFRSHQNLGIILNKKVIIPSREEESRNPRSRSAKLRAFERVLNKE